MAQRVLGIDPGLTRCGYGLISKVSSRSLEFEKVGVFQTPSEMEVADRIGSLGAEIDKLLQSTKPDLVAIERIFSQQNLKTVISVAQISGVVVYLCNKRAIPVTFFTPTQVKSTVTGSGRANKAQMTKMVTSILKLKELPKPADAADALGVATTAAWRGGPVASNTLETPAQIKWRSAEALAKLRQR